MAPRPLIGRFRGSGLHDGGAWLRFLGKTWELKGEKQRAGGGMLPARLKGTPPHPAQRSPDARRRVDSKGLALALRLVSC